MSEVTDTNTGTSQDDTLFPKWLYFFFGGVVLLVAFLLGLYFSQFNSGWGSQETFAQFGDFVGGTLNPVLGFATVALLIWSINVQMKELRLTRLAVDATKDEAEMSRKAMENQAKQLNKDSELRVRETFLAESKREYNILLDRVIVDENDQITVILPFGNSSVNLTYRHVVEMSFHGKPMSDIELVSLNDYFKHNKEIKRHWKRLDHVASQIGMITLDYCEEIDCTRLKLMHIGDVSHLLISLMRGPIFMENMVIYGVSDTLDKRLDYYHSLIDK